MAKVRPISRPPKEYDQGKESEFREKLHRDLDDIVAQIELVRRGYDTAVSLYSNRESLKFPPLGITEII